MEFGPTGNDPRQWETRNRKDGQVTAVDDDQLTGTQTQTTCTVPESCPTTIPQGREVGTVVPGGVRDQGRGSQPVRISSVFLVKEN